MSDKTRTQAPRANNGQTKTPGRTVGKRPVSVAGPVTGKPAHGSAASPEDREATTSSAVKKLVDDATTAAGRNQPKVAQDQPDQNRESAEGQAVVSLNTARDEAEAAVVQLQEKVAASVRVAEEATDRLSGRLLDQVQAMQGAADGIPVRIAEQIRKAESDTGEMVEKAAARTRAGVRQAEDVLDCVQTLVEKQVVAAELATSALTGQFSRNVDATRLAEQAGTGAASRPRAPEPVEMLHSVNEAGTALFESFARTQVEASEFVSHRLREDLDLSTRMMSCTSLGQMREVQASFFRTAMDDYSTAAARLFRMTDAFTPKALREGDD